MAIKPIFPHHSKPSLAAQIEDSGNRKLFDDHDTVIIINLNYFKESSPRLLRGLSQIPQPDIQNNNDFNIFAEVEE